MRIDVFKRVDLAQYGEAWKDCYLEFTMLTQREAIKYKKINKMEDNEEKEQAIVDLLMSKFISGKVLSEGKVVDVKAEDIIDLPVEFLINSFLVVQGSISPKV